jgi:hypothetical protein
MRFALAALAAVSALALSAPTAQAGFANPVVAKLENPLTAAKNDVVAAGVVWACSADTCAARMERRTPVARDCGLLAREVGRITSFTVAGQALNEAGLATCNSRAR